ncbi:MAG TPA: hypothetical protein PK169_01115 [Bacilli bacterium]|nr:hypothetical protein [Bacilli bacterium]
MKNKRQLMEQIKSDIARLGGNYPVLAVYKNNRLMDYALSTEDRVVGEENGTETTLTDLLRHLEND